MESTFFNAFLERLSSATPIKNQSQLANELNVGRAAISLAKQKDSVPSKWILKLANKYHLNSEWLASGIKSFSSSEHLENEGKAVPKIPHLHCKLDKQGNQIVDTDNYLNLKQLTCSQAHPTNGDKLVYLQMQGLSMEPEIKNGDYIIIDQGLTEIYAGSIYALVFGEQITARRIEKGPGVTVIRCENENYPSFHIPEKDMNEVVVIGRVVNIIRKYV